MYSSPATPTGTGAPSAVEHMRRGVRRSAGRSASSPRPGSTVVDLVPGRKGGALGRAVDVQQPARAGRAASTAATAPRIAPPRRRTAARRAPRTALGSSCGQAVEQRRGQEQRVEPAARAMPGEPRRRRARSSRAQHMHRRAVEQRAPDLEGRGVERRVRRLRDAVAAAEPHVVGVAHQPQHRALRNAHPLGPAGRARGVHHIGEALAVRGTVPARVSGRAAIAAASSIQQHQRRCARRQLRRQLARVLTTSSRTGVRQHEAEPLRRLAAHRAADTPPPAFSTASIATTSSGERSRQTATTGSGATARAAPAGDAPAGSPAPRAPA